MEAPADRDARVGDFLDDKLQTAADLQQLDALLANVREQHKLLKQQVSQCKKKILFPASARGEESVPQPDIVTYSFTMQRGTSQLLARHTRVMLRMCRLGASSSQNNKMTLIAGSGSSHSQMKAVMRFRNSRPAWTSCSGLM